MLLSVTVIRSFILVITFLAGTHGYSQSNDVSGEWLTQKVIEFDIDSSKWLPIYYRGNNDSIINRLVAKYYRIQTNNGKGNPGDTSSTYSNIKDAIERRGQVIMKLNADSTFSFENFKSHPGDTAFGNWKVESPNKIRLQYEWPAEKASEYYRIISKSAHTLIIRKCDKAYKKEFLELHFTRK